MNIVSTWVAHHHGIREVIHTEVLVVLLSLFRQIPVKSDHCCFLSHISNSRTILSLEKYR